MAVEQAAAYLAKSQMLVDEYLTLLRTRSTEIHSRGTVTGHDHTIASLWELSLDEIASRSMDAGVLLETCA